jgi:epoxyqueuosine reductase QueG
VTLKEEVILRARQLDIPLVGFAPVERWHKPPFHPWMPEEFYPDSIWPEARSVIVIGLPVQLPIVETSPSIYYQELYKTVNQLLDQYAYRLTLFLDDHGFPSIYLPRDGYGNLGVLKNRSVAFFSHRHAAYLAGLGNFGWNNALLTPRYGPRVRFTCIFTAAEIPGSEMMKEHLCTRCGKCVDACPVKALPGKDYPQGLTEKESCRERSEMLAKEHRAPCGFCIKVCPIGRDRIVFEREGMEYDGSEEKLEKAWAHVRAYGSGKGKD